jgi:hypothetical protein
LKRSFFYRQLRLSLFLAAPILACTTVFAANPTVDVGVFPTEESGLFFRQVDLHRRRQSIAPDTVFSDGPVRLDELDQMRAPHSYGPGVQFDATRDMDSRSSVAIPAGIAWGLELHEEWYAPVVNIIALAIGDLDEDGRRDVVVASDGGPDGGYLARFRQLANGTLQPPLILPYDQSFTNYPSIAILDLDGQYGPDVVSVFRSTAVGGLDSSPVLPSRPSDVLAAIDLDLDGWDDLASVSFSGGGSVHRNQGDGTVVTTLWPIATMTYRDMTKADFNNDGRVDVAILAPAQSPHVKVFLNEPEGLIESISLSAACPNSGASTGAIGAGDVNHDGLADLVIAGGGNSPTSCLLVYFGLPDGQFASALPLSSYDLPDTLRVVDINADGLSDIVVLHAGWHRIGVYLQRSDGTLEAEQLFFVLTPSAYYPHALEIDDLTGDGCPDVAIAGGGLTILRGVGCETIFRSGFESP